MFLHHVLLHTSTVATSWCQNNVAQRSDRKDTRKALIDWMPGCRLQFYIALTKKTDMTGDMEVQTQIISEVSVQLSPVMVDKCHRQNQ